MKLSMPIGKMTGLVAGIALILVAGVCRCAVAATIIRGDTLKKNVVAYVKQNMPWPEDTVRIEFLGDIDDVKLTGENIACRIQGAKKMKILSVMHHLRSGFMPMIYFLKKKSSGYGWRF